MCCMSSGFSCSSENFQPFLIMALKNICSEGYTHLSVSVPPLGIDDTCRFLDKENGWFFSGSFGLAGI